MRIAKKTLLILALAPTMIRAQVTAPDNATGNANINMNWAMTTGYDPSGNIVSQSKEFFDISGKLLQTQNKVFYRSNPTTVYTHVLATQTIRDAYGRDVLTTLPAPINYGDFNYIPGFVTATDGSNYTYKNFDRFNPSGTETDLTNTPQNVGGQATKGTLGWYFGSNNIWEPYTATSNFPYSRKSIYRDGTNNDKKNAATGESFVMGSNHEISGYVSPVSGELTNYLLVRNRFFTVAQMGLLPATLQSGAIQAVQKDANGNETVSIADKDGKILLTARPGTDMSFSNTVGVAALPTINYTQQVACIPGTNFTIQMLAGANNLIIYLTGNNGALTLVYSGLAGSYPLNTPITGTGTLTIQSDASFGVTYTSSGTQYSSNSTPITGVTVPTLGYFKILADATPVTITGSYTLYDMNTEATTALSAGNLNRGYYKVVATSGVVNVTYSNAFTDVTYNFYNGLGQLIASVPPNGVKLLEGTGYTNYATLAAIPFVTTYTYDAQGQQVGGSTPDAGARQYVYRMDGQIRFSQNARQAATGAYSYTNFDAFGRPFESGQYQPDAGGIVFNSAAMTAIVENSSSTGGLTTGTKTDVLISIFDVSDNSHGLSGYIQDPNYLGGAVSTTKRYSSIVNNNPVSTNLVSQTWYNYDESGQMLWMIKYIVSLGPTVGYKTADFTYDAMNRLVKKVLQKNTPAETFVHYYQYDAANGNLLYIYTNTVDNPATEMLQAKYIYYLQGGVKRMELATNLQGIDYTYTLQGSLKAINNSNASADPGNDAVGTNGFQPDAFGETLDYFANDYNNTHSGIQPIRAVNTGGITSDSYEGNVKAMTWYSLKPSGTGGSNSPTTYVYNYDPKYQITGSTWGTGLNFGVNPATFTTTALNKETVTVPGTGAPAYDPNGNILNLQRTGGTGAVTDQLAYTYAPNTNHLSSVANTGTPAGTYTYSYDPAGQEVSENVAGLTKYMRYDATGKVTLIARDAAFTQPVAGFVYDETGQKIEKLSYNASFQLVQVTYYYWDVVYTQAVTGGTSYGALTPQEYSIPGASGKLGIYYKQSNVYVYQLTDHTGNVRAVVAQSGAVQTAEDYYPFGLALGILGSTYRYGFQGQYSEADAETGWNNFQLRMYNPRIARWMITDPHGQFDNPYEGMGNDPVTGTDPDGGWFDWFGHQNADGTVSTIDLQGVHDDAINLVGEKWVNLGEDNIGADQALANGNAYFSNFFQGYFGNFHSQPFDIIANWNETALYQNRAQFSSVVLGRSATTWSPSNDRKIALLDPRVQGPVTNFINRAQQELGVRIFIAESYRSIETQARYYAQGRTTPGKIITHAKPGWSFHQFRLAIDVYPTRANGQPNFNAIVSPETVNIAEQEGLQWGGNFPPGKTDNPHFQMRFGLTITQTRALHGL